MVLVNYNNPVPDEQEWKSQLVSLYLVSFSKVHCTAVITYLGLEVIV